MVNPFRIKEYRFGYITQTTANLAPTYTNHAVNGEILKVHFENSGNSVDAGSIVLAVSGTGEEIWATTSCSGQSLIAYPLKFPVDNTDTAISGTGGMGVPYVVNDVLYISGTALGSGNTFNVNVYYR